MSFAITQGLFLLDIVDHYAILGLPVDAEAKSVRKAYLLIAQRLHPDTCKAGNEADKRMASEFLSKLVNPAYEKLSKPNSWSEYQVILNQLSKQLSSRDTGTLKLKSAIAKTLYEASSISAETYQKSVRELADNNYRDMSTVLAAIAELSELNLVYLNLLGKAGLSAKSTIPPERKIFTPSDSNSTPITAAESTTSRSSAAKSTSPSSSIDAAIWRGEEHLKKNNYAKAILEFRDAIQLDPNSVKAHALMGIAYLQQKQFAMAKVHIKKAYMGKPSDPFVRKAKEALERETGIALDTHDGLKRSTTEKKSGLFGGLFGGKKK